MAIKARRFLSLIRPDSQLCITYIAVVVLGTTAVRVDHRNSITKLAAAKGLQLLKFSSMRLSRVFRGGSLADLFFKVFGANLDVD